MKLGARIERNWALNADVLARNLSLVDPWWGSKSVPVAGGFLVLCGRGQFMNRAVGLAIGEPFTAEQASQIERLSLEAGVVPSVELTPASDRSLAQVLLSRGYTETGTKRVVVLDLQEWSPAEANARIAIERVDENSLQTWQDVSALGWGHSDPVPRRANDSFAAAAFAGANETLLLAYDALDRRPIGCASVSMRDGVATLGGMSTVPSDRNRGTQTALVNYRLAMAKGAGCDIAATSPISESASVRNFARLGFELNHEQVTFELID